MKKILVLGAHADDEIWCAGTISKFVENRDLVEACVFSFCDDDELSSEYNSSMITLGVDNLFSKDFKVRKFHEVRQDILEFMVKLNNELKPDIVLTHSTYDFHQDHQVINQEAIRAFKHSTILGFEMCWNNIDTSTECFVELSQENVNKKIEAMKCYKSQSHRNYFDEEFIRGWMKMRGVQNGCQYAEAFEVIKLKL